jgi:lipoyl-dependent peroxiredoxin
VRRDMIPSAVFPEYELSGHTARHRKRSELRGRDPMIVVLSRSGCALTSRAKVPNLDEAAFARFVGEAEKNCPVSRVLNATITLDSRLIQ